jgi:hypothetical protein
VLLFKKAFHEGLVRGSIDLTFRRWDKPHVRAGGRYRCHPIGVLRVERVERVRLRDIDDREAARAGFDSARALLDFIGGDRAGDLSDDDEVYRVELHYEGDGDRVDIADDARLDAEAIAQIRSALARMDEAGAWTKKTLSLIEKQPRVAASKLAKTLGRETAPFKADVVKLKKLGLTMSFEVGYELSPRGLAYVGAMRAKKTAPKKKRARSSK